MNIKTPEQLLVDATYRPKYHLNAAERDGIKFEKNATLSKKRILEKLELYEDYMEFFINYPDLYLDLILPPNSKFKLAFFQRIFLRVCLRYGRIATTAPRGIGKSFICLLAEQLICILRPGSIQFLCAPQKGQSAQITQRTIKSIWKTWPLLKKEIQGEGLFGKDYTKRYLVRNLVKGY